MPTAFVDTNILVYAADESLPVPRRTSLARKLLLQQGLRISVQVLSHGQKYGSITVVNPFR